MCGIAGLLLPDLAGIDAQVIDALGQMLHHRGPDGAGVLQWQEDGSIVLAPEARSSPHTRVALINRRLAILDPSAAGGQPMSSPDGRFHITYNGEIYNYLELRQELEGCGYGFRSRSDTEVLLTAFQHWGLGALDRLVGMFAFAVLDTQERSLLLARDFFGIKPLYYTRWRDGLAFASEIKALLGLPGVSRRANPQRLFDFLRLGVTDHGADTSFLDICQLPAAHYLRIPMAVNRSLRPERYWRLETHPDASPGPDRASERLRDLFLDSVRLHTRSDVPLGAALSGGIDSSAIVGAIRHLEPARPLLTFSYMADEQGLSEQAWIDLVNGRLQGTGHRVHISPEELLADLNQLVYSQDEPFISTTYYAQYRVFRLARATGIKVLLEGQGGDELLGGYDHHLAARLLSLLRQRRWLAASRYLLALRQTRPVATKALLSGLGGMMAPAGLQYLAHRLVGKPLVPGWMNSAWLAESGVVPRPLRRSASLEALREQLHQTLSETSLPMLLRFGDRNSMACSVESRVPFLTPALASYVLSLPEQDIVTGSGTRKAIFRQAMRGLVPDEILDRQDKVGFDTPEEAWLRALAPWVTRVLSCAAAMQIPALRARVMQQEWEAVLQRRRPYARHIWRWISFILWAQRFSVTFDAPGQRG